MADTVDQLLDTYRQAHQSADLGLFSAFADFSALPGRSQREIRSAVRFNFRCRLIRVSFEEIRSCFPGICVPKALTDMRICGRLQLFVEARVFTRLPSGEVRQPGEEVPGPSYYVACKDGKYLLVFPPRPPNPDTEG